MVVGYIGKVSTLALEDAEQVDPKRHEVKDRTHRMERVISRRLAVEVDADGFL